MSQGGLQIEAAAIVLGCQQELGDKALLLKISYTYVVGHGEIHPEKSYKFLQLGGSILLKGVRQIAEREKSSAVLFKL